MANSVAENPTMASPAQLLGRKPRDDNHDGTQYQDVSPEVKEGEILDNRAEPTGSAPIFFYFPLVISCTY
jgi:hypothetical protein